MTPDTDRVWRDGLAKARARLYKGGMKLLTAPLSLGELIDRLTILEIKAERIASPVKRAHVKRERDALMAIAAPYLEKRPGIAGLKRQLRAVNRLLWDIEAQSRSRFKRTPWSADRSAALLTQIARNNDKRHALKQKISRLGGGAIVEQKSYY